MYFMPGELAIGIDARDHADLGLDQDAPRTWPVGVLGVGGADELLGIVISCRDLNAGRDFTNESRFAAKAVLRKEQEVLAGRFGDMSSLIVDATCEVTHLTSGDEFQLLKDN